MIKSGIVIRYSNKYEIPSDILKIKDSNQLYIHLNTCEFLLTILIKDVSEMINFKYEEKNNWFLTPPKFINRKLLNIEDDTNVEENGEVIQKKKRVKVDNKIKSTFCKLYDNNSFYYINNSNKTLYIVDVRYGLKIQTIKKKNEINNIYSSLLDKSNIYYVNDKVLYCSKINEVDNSMSNYLMYKSFIYLFIYLQSIIK